MSAPFSHLEGVDSLALWAYPTIGAPKPCLQKVASMAWIQIQVVFKKQFFRTNHVHVQKELVSLRMGHEKEAKPLNPSSCWQSCLVIHNLNALEKIGIRRQKRSVKLVWRLCYLSRMWYIMMYAQQAPTYPALGKTNRIGSGHEVYRYAQLIECEDFLNYIRV